MLRGVIWLWLAALGSASAAESTVPVDVLSLTTAYSTPLVAYAAGPLDAKRAILLLHDRFGLNIPLQDWVRRFAAQGYRAVAIDLYGGRHTRQPNLAVSIMDQVDPVAVQVDVDAGLDYLAKPGRKVAILGFDYGADQALSAALQHTTVAATVLYYPRNLETNQDLIQALSSPLLMILANRDLELDPDQLATFSDILTRTQQTEFKVVRFDAQRNFADPLSGHYDEKAAGVAWQTTETFLSTRLGP